jgi:4,5-DOPA dioxygenase extradiol
MPAVFIGHGSPMNALENNRFTAAWHDFARSIPVPRAIVAVSAHWWVNATAVTSMPRPRTIHDFYGFPDQLFAFDYPAPGSPQVAAEVVDALAPAWVGLDTDSWGLDHGTWSVLAHMYPGADVPVVQLSLDAAKSFGEHLELGRRLDSLRESGVLVVCSGNVVHNLSRIDWAAGESGFGWAEEFDSHVRSVMTSDPAALAEVTNHPDYAASVPTAEHFVPLLHLAGIASSAGTVAEVLVGGCVMGSLSMTSYVVR